jgi:hypothetical protein
MPKEANSSRLEELTSFLYRHALALLRGSSAEPAFFVSNSMRLKKS